MKCDLLQQKNALNLDNQNKNKKIVMISRPIPQIQRKYKGVYIQ